MTLKGSNRSRLRQIEKAMRAKSLADHLLVMEDYDHPGVFRGSTRDGESRVWSEEELERLDASGVNITRIVWTRKAGPEENGS